MQTDRNGLLYMRARYYSPELMRFLSEDTVIGSLDKVGSLNRYAFCGGNPVNYIDAGGNIPTALEAAYMAQHIYPLSKKEIEAGKTRELIGDWTYGDDLINVDGGMRMAYYTRTIDGVTEYAVVNKGTNPASLADWENNYYDVFESDIYSENFTMEADLNKSIVEALKFVKSHSESEITFVGHSKGGAEAVVNALWTNRAAIVFNPSTSAMADGLRDNGKITVYVVEGEFLSEYVLGEPSVGNVVYLPKQSWNTIENHDMKSVIKGLKGKNY